MYCTLYCVVFCPKTSLINLSSIARFLGCLPVQKWGMGQILDPRRRSRSLHHLSSSSPRSYKASTWSASSEWWPSPSSPFKVVASEQSEWWLSVHDILHFLPHNDPTQVHLSFFWLHTSKPGCQIFFPENPSTLKLCAGSIPLGQWRNWLPAYLPYSCQVCHHCHDSQSSKWGWTILTSAFFTWFWQNILGICHHHNYKCHLCSIVTNQTELQKVI